MKNAGRLRAVLLACLLVFALGASPAHASTRSEMGWNVGSALVSIVYAPVKVAYAAVGAVFGGIAWGLSGGDPGIVQAVIDPAVRGDYVVTPAHLRGDRRLVFVAPPSAEAAEQVAVDEWGPEASYGDDPYRDDPYEDAYYGN